MANSHVVARRHASHVTCDRPRCTEEVPRTRHASCVPANGCDSSLSTPVRRRATLQVPRIWPHLVCFSISQRQFYCSVCHKCCMYVTITICSFPNYGVRSIRKPLDYSRTRTQTHGTFILQARIAYRPLNVGWYVWRASCWRSWLEICVEFVTDTSVVFASLQDFKNSHSEQDSLVFVVFLP